MNAVKNRFAPGQGCIAQPEEVRVLATRCNAGLKLSFWHVQGGAVNTAEIHVDTRYGEI